MFIHSVSEPVNGPASTLANKIMTSEFILDDPAIGPLCREPHKSYSAGLQARYRLLVATVTHK